jgi:hypothetical protein
MDLMLTISFILFSLVTGYLEAYFWASFPKINQFWSHTMLTIMRGIVALPIAFYEHWTHLLGVVLMFPFIHDGAYYTTRNHINPSIYKDKWFDESTTTGAIWSFDALTRTLYFFVGLILICVI